MNTIDELITILQTAISPVVLISGIGLILLSMTNRFARTTDRARLLAGQIRGADRTDAERIAIQIRILYRRSKIMLVAISFALGSVFFISLMIVSLFMIYYSGMNLEKCVATLFVISMGCLVTSLLLFLQDMSLSLKALKEELRDMA